MNKRFLCFCLLSLLQSPKGNIDKRGPGEHHVFQPLPICTDLVTFVNLFLPFGR